MTTLFTRLPRRHLVVALALVALVALLFPAAVFRGEVFYDRDIHLEWYAQIEGFVRAVAAFSWPVWDNSIAFGQPLLADPSAQVLYPPTWLNLLVLPWTYYTLFVVGHLVFSGVGLYFLALALGISPGGAAVAAGLWVTSGPLLSLVNVWHHFAGSAWIPWVFLAAHRSLRAPRSSSALLWGAAQAAQILAGSADLCAMTGLAVGAYSLRHVHWRELRGDQNRRLIAAAAVAAVFAVALTSALWLPALDVARRSARWYLPETVRSFWSVTLGGMLQAAFPVFVKDLPLAPGARAAFFDGPAPFLASLYLGLGAVGLVAPALVTERRRPAVFVAVLGMASLLIALGRHTPAYALAVATLPPLRILRYPMKAMIFVAFAWTLLAGIGFDRWWRAERGDHRAQRSWRFVAGVVGVLAITAGGAALVCLLGPERTGRWLLDPSAGLGPAEALRPVARELGFAAVVGAIVSVLATFRSRGPSLPLAGAAALVAVFDLYVAHRGLTPTAPRELVGFRPPVVDALGPPDRMRLYVYEYFLTPGSSRRYLGRDDPYVIWKPPPGWSLERAQVLSQRLYPFPPTAGRWGYEGSFDVDTRGLYPAELSALASRLRSVEGTPSHLRLLRLGAVGRVIALHEQGFDDLVPINTIPSLFPEPIRIFRVPDPLPRTYAVGQSRVVADRDALPTLLDPAFDPRAEIVLIDGAPLRAEAGFRGSSRILEFTPDRVRLEADLGAPGYVVLVDAYDPGWHATVDGQPAAALRANVAFRAVRVTAGHHVVEWRYRPAALRTGSGLSLLALVVGLGAAWRVRLRVADVLPGADQKEKDEQGEGHAREDPRS
jgi:hypothetical protein